MGGGKGLGEGHDGVLADSRGDADEQPEGGEVHQETPVTDKDVHVYMG